MLHTDNAVNLDIAKKGNPFPNTPLYFTCLQYTSFEKTLGKGEIARNEQFLFIPQCFLPVWRTSCPFHQIRNCHLQTLPVWKSLEFVIWKRVKSTSMGECNTILSAYVLYRHLG